MGHTPKGKCPSCKRKLTLIFKGMKWVIPSHNIRILGEVNPECKGTGKDPL
jgi:hypothetical protein